MPVHDDLKNVSGLVEATKEDLHNAGWYTKNPVKIRAKRLEYPFYVCTLEGVMRGKEGDYLIEGIEGELYICDEEIFRKTHDKM